MVIFIPTPLGNISDITFRALDSLQKAQIIFCEDTRVTKTLINLLKERFSLKDMNATLVSFNEYNGFKQIEKYKDDIKTKEVVYVSDAGMPSISDPGQKLVEFCQKENIPYTILPGPSTPPLIYAASGFKSGKFTFWGFLSSKGKKRLEEIKEVLNHNFDSILFESPQRIVSLIDEIVKIDPNREIFVAKELTKKFEKYFKGKAKEVLEEIKNSSIKGEWSLVVKGDDKRGFINLEDLKALSLPLKEKSKLLSKYSDISSKEWYQILLNEEGR